MCRVTEVWVVRNLEAVLAKTRGPDVVGVGGHAEYASREDQADHHRGEPGWGWHEREQDDRDDDAYRHDDGQGPMSGQSEIRQIAWPAETVWPTAMLSSETVPSLCALSGCSIFIASSTT